MKIAANSSKDKIASVDGGDFFFLFFNIEKGQIRSVDEMQFSAADTGQCADFLVKHEVDLLLTAGITEKTKSVFDDRGIHLIDNLTGSTRTLVEAYLSGMLFDNKDYFIK